MPSVIASHIKEEGFKRPFLISVVGHLLLLCFFLFATALLPAGEPLIIGTGPGGGQEGDFVTVGLSDVPGGGAGMYKPALTPRPSAAPPAPRPRKAEPEVASKPAENVFVEKERRRQRKPSPSSASSAKGSEQDTTGAIPREPDPGSGGPGASSGGSGGGFGGGRGVTIGQGTGHGVMDSWYVRQVEQRIGQNWLKTSLGQLGRSVRTVVSFEIRPNGELANIQIDTMSGIRSVDIAAQRAVQASNPLPPLPHPFRNRRVKFVAHFEYPPR